MTRPGEQLVEQTNVVIPDQEVRPKPSSEGNDASESVLPAFKSAQPIPVCSDVSSGPPEDFATTISAMVGIEVPDEPDEEMVDYEPSPPHAEMNTIFLSADYYVIGQGEDEVAAAELAFGIEDAVFKKPVTPVRHLKPLHVKGHINGTPVRHMLVDSGAIVNLMPYSLFKKLGCKDEELIRTNMTITGVGGGAPIPSRGIANVELTVGSKTLATAFFVADVEGSYDLILGCDWIHANPCVPSSLHQFLIQWVGDVVEVVHADDSVEIATTDIMTEGSGFACLSGRDLSNYQYISYDERGFVPVSLKPTDHRLNIII